MNKLEQLADDPRHNGSSEDFEQDWRNALGSDPSPFLIFPEAVPHKQFDFFEGVKAGYIQKILQDHDCSGLTLEYGCGAAGMSIFLANSGMRSIACDLSINALRLASLNAEEHLQPEAAERFHRTGGNVFSLPFQDNTFNVVMSYGLLEHFHPEVLPELISEVTRVLQPGGVFIADIAHGRFSSRTVGIWFSLIGSLIYHALTFRWRKLPALPALYLKHYYENDLNEHRWADVLHQAGLAEVDVRVCQPFPPLALSGLAERTYVRTLIFFLPLMKWYFQKQPFLIRELGWLYIASGVKQKH